MSLHFLLLSVPLLAAPRPSGSQEPLDAFSRDSLDARPSLGDAAGLRTACLFRPRNTVTNSGSILAETRPIDFRLPTTPGPTGYVPAARDHDLMGITPLGHAPVALAKPEVDSATHLLLVLSDFGRR